MKRLASFAFFAVCASQIGATDCGQILADSGFDLWCGDRLCYWKLERGDIDQVSTWHDGDDGVAMIGEDVAISQMTQVNSYDTDCIRFDMVADVDETAEVHLQADVFGDGTVDWDERIPTSSWDPVSLRIGVSGYYEGILFRLTKTGPGGATLAQIKAEVVDDEDGPCPQYIDPVSRPLGAACALDEDCDSNLCNTGVCSDCRSDAGCDAGDVCGLAEDVPALLAPWHTCVAEGSRELAESCAVDGECASGVCNGYTCSECSSLTPCADFASCNTLLDVPVSVCESAPRAAGADCVQDEQCASGSCDGRSIGMCDSSGRTCFADDDCPAQADLTPGTCNFFAVAGGTCQ